MSIKTFCVRCDCECEVITIHGSDTEEFWGAPVQRPWSEDVSECCEAEIEEEEVKGNITIEFARRDDCLDKMVPSDLRVLVAKRDTLQTRVRELEDAGQAVVHAQKQRDDASDGLRWYEALRLFNRAMANLAALLEGDEK